MEEQIIAPMTDMEAWVEITQTICNCISGAIVSALVGLLIWKFIPKREENRK